MCWLAVLPLLASPLELVCARVLKMYREMEKLFRRIYLAGNSQIYKSSISWSIYGAVAETIGCGSRRTRVL